MIGDKELVGTLRGFDVYVNMVLEDATEYEITSEGRRSQSWIKSCSMGTTLLFWFLMALLILNSDLSVIAHLTSTLGRQLYQSSIKVLTRDIVGSSSSSSRFYLVLVLCIDVSFSRAFDFDQGETPKKLC